MGRKIVSGSNGSKNSKNNKNNINNIGNRTKTNEKPEGVFTHRLFLIPLVLMLGLVPILMRTTIYRTGLSGYDWFPDGAEVAVDVFLIIKKYAIITIGILMAAILLFRLILKRMERPDKSFLFLVIYAVMVLISGFCSVNRSFSFTGSYERFESVFVVLSYCIAAFYAYTYVRSVEDLKFVVILSGIGMLVTLLIGFFQGLQLDVFQTEFGKNAISSEAFRQSYGELNVTMPAGQAYSTLYNPDFFSMYVCTLLPVAGAFLFAANKVWKRAVCLLFVILMVVVMKMAWAESVWFGLAAGAVFLFMLLMSRGKKTMIISLVVFACLVVAGIAMLPRFVERYTVSSIDERYYSRKIDRIDTNDNDVAFTTVDGRTLSVKGLEADPSSAESETTDGEAAEGEAAVEGTVEISDPALFEELGGSATFAPDENGFYRLTVNIDERTWIFVLYQDSYYYLNPAGKLAKFRNDVPRTKAFLEHFLSGRGVIWNFSLPYLASHVIVGTGSDTFLLVYPQDNYLYEGYMWSPPNTFDVKPHSFYLQQWIEHGAVALFALLLFLVWYVIKSFRLYRKADLKSPGTILGIGCLVGVVSTLVVLLVNDSNVCTSPIFWVILGLGLAVNRGMEEEKNRTGK